MEPLPARLDGRLVIPAGSPVTPEGIENPGGGPVAPVGIEILAGGPVTSGGSVIPGGGPVTPEGKERLGGRPVAPVRVPLASERGPLIKMLESWASKFVGGSAVPERRETGGAPL